MFSIDGNSLPNDAKHLLVVPGKYDNANAVGYLTPQSIVWMHSTESNE